MRQQSQHSAFRSALAVLLFLGGFRANAQAPPEASLASTPDRVTSPGSSSPTRPVRSATEIARWNDRTTPRRMLETFFFAISCYDLAPELIVNAIDCLDFGKIGQEVNERDAALMEH